ncbi:flagellar transcriptional regulator FlhD [Burkholderia sp. LMG 13014]|uniref:flagellar transcriptional regulator FlhD n=1 Tax=Burkholderia sp. LMG 13014 TaxID=2709306 RepID=UPI001963DA37|nr:flagellar transcriptional regulator FlhD [Burkholderia sp. LMG 13014]
MSNVDSDTLNEIQSVNLSYLRLLQTILRDSKVEGMSRLGIAEPIADRLLSLSEAQMILLARTTQLLLRFRFDDKSVLSALADKVGSRRSMPQAAEEEAG